jgi:hypothetical protein
VRTSTGDFSSGILNFCKKMMSVASVSPLRSTEQLSVDIEGGKSGVICRCHGGSGQTLLLPSVPRTFFRLLLADFIADLTSALLAPFLPAAYFTS